MYRRFEERITAEYPDLPEAVPTEHLLEALSELPESRWRFILDTVIRLGLATQNAKEDPDARRV